VALPAKRLREISIDERLLFLELIDNLSGDDVFRVDRERLLNSPSLPQVLHRPLRGHPNSGVPAHSRIQLDRSAKRCDSVLLSSGRCVHNAEIPNRCWIQWAQLQGELQLCLGCCVSLLTNATTLTGYGQQQVWSPAFSCFCVSSRSSITIFPRRSSIRARR